MAIWRSSDWLVIKNLQSTLIKRFIVDELSKNYFQSEDQKNRRQKCYLQVIATVLIAQKILMPRKFTFIHI